MTKGNICLKKHFFFCFVISFFLLWTVKFIVTSHSTVIDSNKIVFIDWGANQNWESRGVTFLWLSLPCGDAVLAHIIFHFCENNCTTYSDIPLRKATPLHSTKMKQSHQSRSISKNVIKLMVSDLFFWWDFTLLLWGQTES